VSRDANPDARVETEARRTLRSAVEESSRCAADFAKKLVAQKTSSGLRWPVWRI